MSIPVPEQPHPHQSQPDQPAHPVVLVPPPVPRPARDTNAGVEVLVTLGVVAALAVVGVPLGLLWTRYAPHAHKFVLPDGSPLYIGDERLVAGEGWYVFATLATGLVAAVLAWVLLRRYRGPLILLALAVGGIASGVVTYAVGHQVGAAHADYLLSHSPPGTEVRMPVDLVARRMGLWHGWLPYVQGDLLCMAIAAVLVYLVLAGFSLYPSLRPPRPDEVSSGYS